MTKERKDARRGSLKLGDSRYRVSPGSNEPIARSFIEFLGGPLGRFSQVGTQRWWTPLRLLVTIALSFLSLGYMAKANCLHGNEIAGVAQLDWSGNKQYVSACYSDIIPLYSGRGLDRPGFPYAFSWQENGLTRYMEYPVLTGIFQWIMAMVARLGYPVIQAVFPGVPEVSFYFTVTALVMALLWAAVVAMLAELAENRVWDVVLVAASPLVIVHAFTNWDILAIAAAIGALLAFRRHHLVIAGVLIGVGTSHKLWPVFLLGALFIVALRSKKLRTWFVLSAGAAAAWLIINVPVMLTYPDAWGEFLRLNSQRGWEWTTIYAVLSREFGWSGLDPAGVAPTNLNMVTLLLFIAACVGIAVLGLRVRRQPRIAELVFLIVAAFLLINKVWSPQYSLWLVPFAALALPYWRLIFAWGLIDAATWPILMWHLLGAENKGAPAWLLDLFILGRDGLIIIIAVLVIRQMLGKSVDKVSRDHAGRDPLAGPFGCQDRCGSGSKHPQSGNKIEGKELKS
ncbi:glycosyltransferase 87 family protein [Corynebacterium pseudotuberculosis]|uniref:glycosyltransferase family 87 protein n=1 Tax=Corynebacterium pseudotuberculosis TaxID=1719 RepID=UPI0004D62DFC|nr:glycosyltransferase 87 family protein [Corynebacterium pseudotuberculosis]KEX89365.1 Multimodular transpeptidase-transglycosylase [Corynebacterium pseudotuberculosis]UTO24419.1 glycosyltransferase 87 family protein [Corynebacterium pseudotuberculosis]VTQ74185.1 hypothetical membrane protein [Corynebacterium pseudotuberculosis]